MMKTKIYKRQNSQPHFQKKIVLDKKIKEIQTRINKLQKNKKKNLHMKKEKNIVNKFILKEL